MNQTPSFEQIREQQKTVWNKFSPGWKKWDEETMLFLKPMGDEIVAAIESPAPKTVLDIATGTGEPGLTLARKFPGATVTGTDLSEGMLETAEARAKQLGITNYRTQPADVCALPFPDATFDAISCRMGFMFFPDMAMAARQIVRVLKPGGHFATSVWNGPEKNPWITTMMKSISQHTELPHPPPGAPGMFRCAAPGLIAGFLREAGLKDVTEKEIFHQVTYKSADEYWTMMNEVAAPVVAALSKVDDATRAKVKASVYAALQPHAGADGVVKMDFSARIIAGKK